MKEGKEERRIKGRKKWRGTREKKRGREKKERKKERKEVHKFGVQLEDNLARANGAKRSFAYLI